MSDCKAQSLPDRSAAEETYALDDSDDEGLKAMDDIDRFEQRLANGQGPVRSGVAAAASKAKENKQRQNIKKGNEYVQAAVKAKDLSDTQLEAAEAKSAVDELAKFEARVGLQ